MSGCDVRKVQPLADVRRDSVDQYGQGFRHTGIGREGGQPLKAAQ